MNETLLQSISEGLELLKLLSDQIEENKMGLQACIAASLHDPVSAGADTAINLCRKMQKQLKMLREEELHKAT